MDSQRTTFTFLLYSLSDDNAQRAVAYMRAIHEHRGRAWVFADRPIAGMPARIIGVTP
jgi:hypothetical protein